MKVTDDNGREPELSEQAADRQRARERMKARHRLIDAMISNNQLQLKNECARGGTEIEIECAKRDVARAVAAEEAQAELDRLTARMQTLLAEQTRLVAERDWLDTALQEFESGRPTGDSQPGNA
ncbi:MAG: hypothetical protein JWQ94_3712 [Tardiphaga sp.]|nr:hypothetical protein [Tardiphaga sp.]